MSYLTIDPGMTPQERRQQAAREAFRRMEPAWEDSVMALARLFGESAGRDMTVLDAGCGRGNHVLETHRALLRRIVGVDAARSATEGNGLADEILVADLARLPFPDASFDAVTSLWVLEHLERPADVLAEIKRVLKPGGRFFFVTPYAFSYVLLAKRLVGTALTGRILKRFFGRTEDDTFRTFYAANTPKDLGRLAGEAGMTERTLIENPDPSYLALNGPLFRLALLIQWVASRFGSKFATMHLIGVFERPAEGTSFPK